MMCVHMVQEGQTALLIAVTNGHEAIAKLLVEQGAQLKLLESNVNQLLAEGREQEAEEADDYLSLVFICSPYL